ncbi:MAG: F0F1 ATP synthase subunit A [Candidatus Paceibacteria bacterium]
MEEGLHISIAPSAITELFGLSITPTLITSWAVVALLVVSALFIGRSLREVPGKGQVAVEYLIAGTYGYVEEALGSAKLASRFFPLIMTLFVFILAGNLLGLFPFMESVGIYQHGEFTPLFYPINADLNIPLALTIISFLTIEISGVIYLGFFTYVRKFLNFSSPMAFAVGLLEIIGNLARLVSLSFRLFGNILAGHILILVIMFFVPFLATVPFIGFEIFVALMQAAIFALLTLFFIKLSIEKPHAA